MKFEIDELESDDGIKWNQKQANCDSVTTKDPHEEIRELVTMMNECNKRLDFINNKIDEFDAFILNYHKNKMVKNGL